MVKLSVIIVSYNTKQITHNCLESIIKQTKIVDYEIIVIDNASSDKSQVEISNFKAHNPKTKIVTIFNQENVGFARANNQGVKEAQGEYILFLNSDVILNKVNFNDLFKYLDTHREVGALTVRVNLPDGRLDPASHRGFPTLWRSFCYFFGLEKIFGRLPLIGTFFGGYHLLDKKLTEIHEIDSPSGAFFLIRRKLMIKLGGFDERFFMYGEDIDLAFRIKNKGNKIIYYPDQDILHLKYQSGLSTENPLLKNKTKRHFFEAMKLFYHKHYASSYPSIINKLVDYTIDWKNTFS